MSELSQVGIHVGFLLLLIICGFMVVYELRKPHD